MNLIARIIHMVRPARTTTATVETGSIHTVQVRHNQFDVRSMNSMQQVGVASAYPVNTDVMTVNVSGDNSNGVVIASNHQQFRPKNMNSGETMLYDCGATQQYVYLQSDGNIAIAGFHSITVACDTSVTITAPNVTINGNLGVTGSVTAGSGTGDSVTLQHHSHNDSHGDTISAPVAST